MTEIPRDDRLPLWKHLRLLWGLRVSLALGALEQRWAAASAIGGALVAVASTFFAARATYSLFSSEAVHANGQLRLLLALLLGFLASTLWIVWPVVTASIDDAAELSRFALFPVTQARLFLASVLAGLVEPRTLPVWGALLGAVHALCPHHLAIGFGATVLFALFCVSWGRLGLHVLLNLFRQRRSAETMGAGLLVLLFGSAFVPPPDLTWLRDLNATSPTIDDKFLRGAIEVFTLLPTGGWARAVLSADARSWHYLPISLTYLGVFALLGYWGAYWLLVRFHRRAGRSLPSRDVVTSSTPSFGGDSIDSVLLEREWRDLLLNPRARFTVALPFFLTILVKLAGARALLVELVGSSSDAWLVGGISSYGALVLGAGFAQNAFGYDGNGARLLLAAPIDPAQVLKAKNIVHAGLAIVLGLALIVFYSMYVAWPPAWVALCAACSVTYQALFFAAIGNVLSIVSPRKFHPSLKRKDRVSPLTTGVGLGAAAIAVAPGAALLKGLHGGNPGAATFVGFALLPMIGIALWRTSIPAATTLLETRKPQLLVAVARE